MLTCPKCEATMEPVTLDGTTVDRCLGCGGLWFDAHEREAILAAHGARRLDVGDPEVGRAMNEIDRIPCPRCSGRMVRLVSVEHPEVRYEQCAACGGSFLDAGELSVLERGALATLLNRLLAWT